MTQLYVTLYREVRYIRGLLCSDSTVCNFALLRGKGKGERGKGKGERGKQTSIEAKVITNVKMPDWIGTFQNRARHDCSKRGQHCIDTTRQGFP